MGNLLATIPLEILAIDFTVLEPVTEGRENALVEPVNDPGLTKKVHRLRQSKIEYDQSTYGKEGPRTQTYE